MYRKKNKMAAKKKAEDYHANYIANILQAKEGITPKTVNDKLLDLGLKACRL